jgi:hypothetical protein
LPTRSRGEGGEGKRGAAKTRRRRRGGAMMRRDGAIVFSPGSPPPASSLAVPGGGPPGADPHPAKCVGSSSSSSSRGCRRSPPPLSSLGLGWGSRTIAAPSPPSAAAARTRQPAREAGRRRRRRGSTRRSPQQPPAALGSRGARTARNWTSGWARSGRRRDGRRRRPDLRVGGSVARALARAGLGCGGIVWRSLCRRAPGAAVAAGFRVFRRGALPARKPNCSLLYCTLPVCVILFVEQSRVRGLCTRMPTVQAAHFHLLTAEKTNQPTACRFLRRSRRLRRHSPLDPGSPPGSSCFPGLSLFRRAIFSTKERGAGGDGPGPAAPLTDSRPRASPAPSPFFVDAAERRRAARRALPPAAPRRYLLQVAGEQGQASSSQLP